MQPDHEVRVWAKSRADMLRGRMLEYEIWDAIAENGREWAPALRKDGTPDFGGRLMTPRECFSNSQRTVLGMTAYPAHRLDGDLRYVEGFALTHLNMWSHHAWVARPDGLIVDRTWKDGAQRYIGVPMEAAELFNRSGDLGGCLLSRWPAGIAWGVGMTPEDADRMFGSRKKEVNDSAEVEGAVTHR